MELVSINSSYIKTRQGSTIEIALIEWLMSITLVLGIITNFSSELPEKYSSPIFYGLLMAGYCGIFAYVVFFHHRKSVSNILTLWICVGAYLLVIGLIRGNPLSVTCRSAFLHQDLRYFMYIALGIVASDKIFREWLFRLLKVLGIISIVFGILAVMNVNISTTFMARQNVWSLPYYFWWLSCACYAINYATMRMNGKIKLAGLGVLVAYVVCGALFLKKVVIVNTLFLLFMCEIFAPDNCLKKRTFWNRLFKGIFVILVAAGIALFAISKIPAAQNLIDLYIIRFQQAGDSFDRFVEFQNYFNQANVADLILGKGYGNYVYLIDQYIGGYYQANAMHIGLTDILYVGGIPYCVVWIALFVVVIRRIKIVAHLEAFERACLAVACLYIISLLYEGSRTVTMGPFIIAIAFAILLQAGGRTISKAIRKSNYLKERI